ncbi:RNA methyltransferase [Aquimarina sp. ERC-38]|uniref:TrmH family RNA methyltransferase n=1 Tax=Aquimarina sp. ERC-38 TaxID=2949996 RepID=UPI0022458A4C|nr:RNA methyltransferase [Aquimarina sp. ERC-38]UZO80754.1 RNA methyltransferase [Aquimarina sp. ERC-38]
MVDKKLLNYLEGFITPRRKQLFTEVLAQRTNFYTVVIEDVYQLHNTSAVIRSCDVFGIQQAHVIEERNRKKIDREIAMGAQKWVSIHRHHHTRDCINRLKEKGYQIVATTPHQPAVALSNFNFSKPSAFFFGQEQGGLSEDVLNAADSRLYIPMYGFTESLNISVSAAIILQSATQHLQNSELTWQLTEEEQLYLRWEWTKKVLKSHDQLIAKYYEIHN